MEKINICLAILLLIASIIIICKAIIPPNIDSTKNTIKWYDTEKEAWDSVCLNITNKTKPSVQEQCFDSWYSGGIITTFWKIECDKKAQDKIYMLGIKNITLSKDEWGNADKTKLQYTVQ